MALHGPAGTEFMDIQKPVPLITDSRTATPYVWNSDIH